jgi:hypothetical protein
MNRRDRPMAYQVPCRNQSYSQPNSYEPRFH